MDIYESIADLLNIDEGTDRDTETALLEKLNELNNIYRDTKRRREELEDKISELRKEISEHNRNAEDAVRVGNEQKARRQLKLKKTKMRKAEKLSDEKNELRQKEDKIMEQRKRLKDKIQRVRERKP
jgi:phage shock protein A